MVHRQGDTKHGADNPLPSKDGSSEPAERAWRNPTVRPQGSPSSHSTREHEGSTPQPAQAWSHPDDLRSRSPPLPRQTGERLEKLCSPAPVLIHLGPSGAVPAIASQHSSSGLGLSHRSTNWLRGRAARLYFSLLCSPRCSSGNAHMLPLSLRPRCPFSSSKGK